MSVIEVSGLEKVYRVHEKREGLLGSVRALFRRKYKTVRAVDGIDFAIEPGEMVGFLGPNGAGKTTTLKMLSGLIFPTAGEVTVLGFTPWERKDAYRRQFALLMGQKNQLWWDLPAAESFRLHQEIYEIDEQQFQNVRGELTELLQVADLVDQPVRELSLGERMKMELIAALLHSPKILLLDEPTIGLDVVAQTNIRECLRDYNKRNQITMLLTSHYMQDIEALCDRVMIINRGKMVLDGPLSDVVDRYATHKVVTLRFQDGQIPRGLEHYGDIVEHAPPMVKLRMDRETVATEASRLLSEHAVSDFTVEDPPIEETVSRIFAESGHEQAEVPVAAS